MSNLLKGLSALKVKEVPAYVSKYAGENLTPAKVESRLSNWANNYQKKVRGGPTPGPPGAAGPESVRGEGLRSRTSRAERAPRLQAGNGQGLNPVCLRHAEQCRGPCAEDSTLGLWCCHGFQEGPPPTQPSPNPTPT